MRDKIILVGTDGTDTGTAAVDWAAREAQRRAMPLRIVHACVGDGELSQLDTGNEYVDIAWELTEAVMATACERARQTAPDADIRAHILVGEPGYVLLEASRGAELLVVGSRGRGGLTGLLLGSVSRRIATQASCPVVMVRGRDDATGPIVAGVDDTPTGDLVLESAFGTAAGRGCPVIVVRSYLPVLPLVPSGGVTRAAVIPEQDADQRRRLEKRVAPWRARFPDVPVREVLTRDSAAVALVKESRRAQLVVVGSQGHGVLGGTLRGSTGLQLLHQAECPVHIIPAHR